MEDGLKNMSVNSLGVGDLERLLDGFPWYAHARQVLLYKLAQMGEECFNQKFKDYAAFLHSRETVYFKTRDILSGKVEVDLSETNFISDAGVVKKQAKTGFMPVTKKEEETQVEKNIIAVRSDVKDDQMGSLHMIVNKSKLLAQEEAKPIVVNIVQIPGHDIERQPEQNIDEQLELNIVEQPKNIESAELVDKGIELDDEMEAEAMVVQPDSAIVSVNENTVIVPVNENAVAEQEAIDFDELNDLEYNGSETKPRIYILGGDYFSREDFEQLKEEEEPAVSYTDLEPIMSTEDFDSPEFCTETLAKIYAEQGYYEQAIDVYAKLILLYPEKSTYFATLVNEIKLKN